MYYPFFKKTIAIMITRVGMLDRSGHSQVDL